jgi:hypothetical protein
LRWVTLPHPHQVPLPTRHCPTLVASDTSSSPPLVPFTVQFHTCPPCCCRYYNTSPPLGPHPRTQLSIQPSSNTPAPTPIPRLSNDRHNTPPGLTWLQERCGRCVAPKRNSLDDDNILHHAPTTSLLPHHSSNIIAPFNSCICSYYFAPTLRTFHHRHPPGCRTHGERAGLHW